MKEQTRNFFLMKIYSTFEALMIRFIRIALVISASVFATQSYAEDRHGSAMGAGAQTCGQYAKAYARDPDKADHNFFVWAQGWMSGANWVLIMQKQVYQDFGAIPLDRQRQMIREYCNEHPLENFDLAVLEVFMSFPERPVSKN